MVLFTPWYEKRGLTKCEKIAKTINNQNKLKQAALKSSYYSVRCIAASKITDDDFLFSLIYSDKDLDVRSAVIDALRNHDMLTSIAHDSQIVFQIRAKAARKIGEINLANEVEEHGHLEAALHGYKNTHSIDSLKTMDSLLVCARQCSSDLLRTRAISRIHDDNVLEKLINAIGEEYDLSYRMKYPGVLASAVEQVNGETVLERLMNSKYEDVRSCVLSRITDTAFLSTIARENDNFEIKYKAAKRLPDKMFNELCADYPEIGERYKRESERYLSSSGSFTNDSSDWVKSITGRD